MTVASTTGNFVCGRKVNVEHALSWNQRGIVTIRHNQVRGSTASFSKIISSDVGSEPSLLSLSGGSISGRASHI